MPAKNMFDISGYSTKLFYVRYFIRNNILEGT
jgi:hypothetical protein